MSRVRFWVIMALGTGCLFVPLAQSQPAANRAKVVPKLEAVAETRLLMEGLANPNLRALGKLLGDKPKEDEAWTFARGQALLIAETGNLLLLRPPRNANSEEPWMSHSMELRESAATLARATAAKDYQKSRAALAGVANACNRCHQTFRVPNRIDPFSDE
jgi:hypothetical protein